MDYYLAAHKNKIIIYSNMDVTGIVILSKVSQAWKEILRAW